MQKFFISYRRSEIDDQRLAHFLFERLNAAGHEPFIDVGMPVGTDWTAEIDRRIDWCDALIVLLSEQSMQSEMVQGEIRRAHHRRRPDGRPRILPVRVKYEGPLDYEIDSYLGRIHYVLWHGQDDDERVLAAILGEGPTKQPTQPSPVSLRADSGRPQAAMDPRALGSHLGGTMLEGDPFYVRRAADDYVDLLARQEGRTLVIKAPRQMGKSSLLCRYLADCQKAEKSTAYIDFQRFSDNTLSDYPRFLGEFAEELLDTLGLTIQGPLPQFTRQQKFIRFVRDEVLTRIGGPIVFAFDEVDRVLGRAWQGDFFAMLRSWHNDRAYKPIWRKVDLALVIATEPYLLIDRPDQSPFNVVQATELAPFTLNESSVLNKRYYSVLNDNDLKLLQNFFYGHPYLLRLAFHRLSEDAKLTVSKLIEIGARDDSPFGDHLRAKLFAIKDSPVLLKALKDLIVRRTPLDPMTFWRLHNAGLVTRNAEGLAIPFNVIYARFFRDLA